jgi:hypothetical protein
LKPTGQVRWGWYVANIGKGIATDVVFRQYIKIGNERFQPGRNLGVNAIELPESEPLIVPPNLPLMDYSTTVSRPGINKDFFTTMINTDRAMGLLIEFSYSDVSGKNTFVTANCMEHFASGAITNTPPNDCEKAR